VGGGERGWLRPEVQPLTLLYTMQTEKIPFCIPFIKTSTPFTFPLNNTASLFLNSWNEVNP